MTTSSGNISLSSAPMTINGQPLGGGFSFAYDLGGSTSDIASQAYNFLAANNTQDQQFLNTSIAGTQSFLAHQAAPLMNAAIGLQQMNANQQSYQQNTALAFARESSFAGLSVQPSFYGTVNNLSSLSANTASQATSQIGANTSNSNAASVQASQSGSWCFITTAVCESSKKPDDCEELTILRKFRDEYMLIDDDRKKLVDEYYRIAPEIVAKLKEHDNSDEIFKAILDEFIYPCIIYIKKGCFECAKNHYIRMIECCKVLIEDV